MGNVVTVMWYQHMQTEDCHMQRWCENAKALQTLFNTTTTIISNDDRVKEFCPRARILDTGLDSMFREYEIYVKRFANAPAQLYMHRVYLHKIAVLNPNFFAGPVIFLDTDVDISIGKAERHQFLDMKKVNALFQKFLLSTCRLQATADHSALLNSGVMLVKPDEQMYKTALGILETNRFNYTHGFEFKGLPKEVIISHPLGMVSKAKGYWANTWQFVGGESDQGLLAYLSMSTGQYCQPSDWSLRVRHFWASD
eukprot:CAMPEP_0119322222 /NCGR_PEP_ID=MMETSP1333-20130426/57579_1 /TAXON_ID=418940 /ORGANISM="Scyphosphaera apsteinii, Strain RCC1455" /LENGTH=253 /DNA_ID=CAMNT_0007329393 /DNA_START=200 /DNA_END=958 /DNA_ORIENTATION=+